MENHPSKKIPLHSLKISGTIMEPLKTAVIGVGYLGRFHAQKFLKLEDSNLLGVIDNDVKRAEEVGKELGVPWFESLEAMTVQPDAVSIAVPTIYHFETGKSAWKKGFMF